MSSSSSGGVASHRKKQIYRPYNKNDKAIQATLAGAGLKQIKTVITSLFTNLDPVGSR
jgi:hypothetical protein